MIFSVLWQWMWHFPAPVLESKNDVELIAMQLEIWVGKEVFKAIKSDNPIDARCWATLPYCILGGNVISCNSRID